MIDSDHNYSHEFMVFATRGGKEKTNYYDLS